MPKAKTQRSPLVAMADAQARGDEAGVRAVWSGMSKAQRRAAVTAVSAELGRRTTRGARKHLGGS